MNFAACDGGFPNSVAKHPGTVALIRGPGIALVTLSSGVESFSTPEGWEDALLILEP